MNWPRMVNFTSETTAVGNLIGRDAIFLDYEFFDHTKNTLSFEGDLSESSCSELRTDDFIPYLLTFKKVTEYSRIPLDTWYDESNVETESCFSSAVINGFLPNQKYTLYILETYDWVFKIYADSYILKIGDEIS